MSEEDPYEQEFEESLHSDEEPDYFKPVPNGSTRATGFSKPHPVPAAVHEDSEPQEDEYADEDFEEKSSELVATPPPQKPASKNKASSQPQVSLPPSKSRPVADDGNRQSDEDFFMTSVKGKPESGETTSKRRVSDEKPKSNTHSTGKLTTTSYMDSPDKAFKLLSFLKKENIDLRSKLKEINERLNDIIDRKIAESNFNIEPKRAVNPESKAKVTNTQLLTAKKQIKMLKQEQKTLYSRLQQVEDPDFIEELQATVNKKERLFVSLQKTQKHIKKQHHSQGKTIEKEIIRGEPSTNARTMQELQLENEGVKLRIKELESEAERSASTASDQQDLQERLEQKYAKLMLIARDQGAFDDHSRANKKVRKMKASLEDRKQALAALVNLSENSIKQFRRQEKEIKSELDNLKIAQKAAKDRFSEKQREMTDMLQDLEKLRPHIAGTGYEALLQRIATGIKEKETDLESQIPPLKRSAGQASGSTSQETADGKKPKKTIEKPREKSPFLSGQRSAEKEERKQLPKESGNPYHEGLQELEKKSVFAPTKPVGIASKPSLFSKPNFESFEPHPTEEEKEAVHVPPVQPLRMEDGLKKLDLKPNEDSFPVKEPRKYESIFDAKTKAETVVPEPTKPATEEIETLETFKSRRRVKKTNAEQPMADALGPSLEGKGVLGGVETLVSGGTDNPSIHRNRDHLLTDDPKVVPSSVFSGPETAFSAVKPVAKDPLPPSLFESGPVQSKPGRNRTHLFEEVPTKDVSGIGNLGFGTEEGKSDKRDRSHLMENPVSLNQGKTTEQTPLIQPQSLTLLDRNKELKVSNGLPKTEARTAELAKKAEKGGFFSLEDQSEDLDFTDLNQVVAPIKPISQTGKTEPQTKKPEAQKLPQVLDLEESDIML